MAFQGRAPKKHPLSVSLLQAQPVWRLGEGFDRRPVRLAAAIGDTLLGRCYIPPCDGTTFVRRGREEMAMQLTTIRIDKPDATNFILGQTHFIKSVEDIHETLVGAVPGIKFGLAFCEASGKCLVRSSGTDAEMVALAQKNATALGAGHCFIVFLGEGYYPVNVLNAIKMVPEVCRIFCATANPVEALMLSAPPNLDWPVSPCSRHPS